MPLISFVHIFLMFVWLQFHIHSSLKPILNCFVLSVYSAMVLTLHNKKNGSQLHQTRISLRTGSHLLKKSLMENFILCVVSLGRFFHQMEMILELFLRIERCCCIFDNFCYVKSSLLYGYIHMINWNCA